MMVGGASEMRISEVTRCRNQVSKILVGFSHFGKMSVIIK